MYEPYEKEWLDAEDRCDALKHQRNQLREALESCVNAFKTTNVYNGAVHYAQDKARAALKATEEG